MSSPPSQKLQKQIPPRARQVPFLSEEGLSPRRWAGQLAHASFIKGRWPQRWPDALFLFFFAIKVDNLDLYVAPLDLMY